MTKYQELENKIEELQKEVQRLKKEEKVEQEFDLGYDKFEYIEYIEYIECMDTSWYDDHYIPSPYDGEYAKGR